MSNIGKILGGAIIVLLVSAAFIALVTGAVMWLVPIATAGAVHLGFAQTLAGIVLVVLAGVFHNASRN